MAGAEDVTGAGLDRAQGGEGALGAGGAASHLPQMTPKQMRAAEIRLAHPDWSERRVLDEAGYSRFTVGSDLPPGGTRSLAKRRVAVMPPAIRPKIEATNRELHRAYGRRLRQIADDPHASESAIVAGFKVTGEFMRNDGDEERGDPVTARLRLREAIRRGLDLGIAISEGRTGPLGWRPPKDDAERLRRLARREYLRRSDAVDDEIEAHPRTIDVQAVRVEPGAFKPTKRLQEGTR